MGPIASIFRSESDVLSFGADYDQDGDVDARAIFSSDEALGRLKIITDLRRVTGANCDATARSRSIARLPFGRFTPLELPTTAHLFDFNADAQSLVFAFG